MSGSLVHNGDLGESMNRSITIVSTLKIIMDLVKEGSEKETGDER
jgi:hypothetical protein